MLKLIICLFLLTTSIVKSVRRKRECKQPITTVSGSTSRQGFCAGDLIFEDNFDELDLSKWQHEITLYGGGNNQFQWYVNDTNNTFTKDGTLFIRPTLTSDYLGDENKLYSETIDLGDSCTNNGDNSCKRTGTSEDILNPIRSGQLKTINSFAFKYGKVEIRAKMPAGDWLWPALWLMPRNNTYGPWPRSGEIDLAECRGNRNLYLKGINLGVTLMSSTLHWGPDYSHNPFQKTNYELYNPDYGFNMEFRTYELLWTEDYISFSINGEEIGTVNPETSFWDYGGFAKQGVSDNPWEGREKMAPFDQEFYIIFNLAVGGTDGYFLDNATNIVWPKPWNNSAPHAMTDFWKAHRFWLPTWNLDENNAYNASLIVDYIKVWAI